MIQKKKTHYYLYNGNRYENMKDCLDAIGNGKLGSRRFKHMFRIGLVEKIMINQGSQIAPKNKICYEKDI